MKRLLQLNKYVAEIVGGFFTTFMVWRKKLPGRIRIAYEVYLYISDGIEVVFATNKKTTKLCATNIKNS